MAKTAQEDRHQGIPTVFWLAISSQKLSGEERASGLVQFNFTLLVDRSKREA